MDENRLIKLINETKNKDPAGTSMGILKFIAGHRELVYENFGKYLKNFEDYFDILNNAIFNLNYMPKKHWPQYKGTQFLLFPETLKTLHRAHEDLFDGYYEESMMLLRSVYETYIKMIYIAIHPNDIESIFYKRAGKRNFNLSNFVKDELNLDWGWLYKLLSSISHGKTYKHLDLWIKTSTGKYKDKISLYYKYDKDAISRPINMSIFLLYLLFHLVYVTFIGDIKSSKVEKIYIKKMDNIDIILREMLRNSPNKFSELVQDIEKIDKIIKQPE